MLGKMDPQLQVIWPPGSPRLDPLRPSRDGTGGTTMLGLWWAWKVAALPLLLLPLGAEISGGGRGMLINDDEDVMGMPAFLERLV